jgi:signal transduction histidine kinase
MQRLSIIGIGTSELDVIRSMRSSLEDQIPSIVDNFYTELMQHPILREIIAQNTTTDRLKLTFRNYLKRLFSGSIDDTYDHDRIQIGHTHHRVGLPLKWYLGMFSFLENQIFLKLSELHKDTDLTEWMKVQSAISGLMKYDQLLAVDAYVEAHTAELIEQTEKAESAKKSKSLFLAKVSHELRTPLSSILGYTDLILDTAKEISPLTRQHLSVLHRNATNLLSMINGLIEIGHVDSGKWHTQVTHGSLNALLDDMAINAQGLLAGKPVQVRRDYASKDQITLLLDFAKLRQVLLNLVSNACKFTDSGYVAIDFKMQDNLILIMVRDSGPGVAPEHRGKIFDEFFRAPNEKSKKPGSGLGLPLVKSLVESMGGAMEISDEQPRGSVFIVKLPIQN